MSDSIEIENYNGSYYLQWVCDGEEGACIGDTKYSADDLANADREDRWFIAATIAVAGMSPTPKCKPCYGFQFDTIAEARAALALAKAAKNHPYPMPEWAAKAIAEGWKAPKGWKP